jgi:hypothetical protein
VSNRLGFAVQLCVLRYPGRALDSVETPPVSMLSFVANQIGTDPRRFGDYARRGETRREHLIELQKLLHLRSFRLADWRGCLKVGSTAAWATDRGEPIVHAMLSHLRATNVLLPAATVLERIGLAARVRARKKTFQALADGLTDAKQDALDKLLMLDPNVRRSRFAWLRDYAESPAPSNMLGLIDRLDYIRDLGIGSERTGRIHAARLDRLVEEGAIMTVQHICDLEPARGQPSWWPRSLTWRSDSPMRRLSCSKNTSGPCSRRRKTGTNGVSKPPSATSPKPFVPPHHRGSHASQGNRRGRRRCG